MIDLASVKSPYFYLLQGSNEDFGRFAYSLNYEMGPHQERCFVVRVLRGNKMRTRAALFDEFVAAL
jgi:hypothetical protein